MLSKPFQIFAGIYVLLSLTVYYSFPTEKDIYFADKAASLKVKETPQEIVERILLAGDTGITEPSPLVLKSVAELATELPQKTTTVLLGDNVYPSGIPTHTDSTFPEKVGVLRDQARLLKASGARYLLTPGNHDWGKRTEPSREAVLRAIEVLEKVSGTKGLMQPPNACPGPDEVMIGSSLRLIFFDMQPLLKEVALPENCSVRTVADIIPQFARFAGDPKVETIFLQHHPLRSHAPHSGEYSVNDHLFPLLHLNKWLYIPLPVFGTLKLSAVHRASCPQHSACSKYKEIAAALREALKPIKPVVCAAGHDHTLQVLEGDSVCGSYLVSGAGAKLDFVGHGSDTWFAASLPGFLRLERYRNGRYLLAAHVVKADGTDSVVFRRWVK